MEKLEEVMRKDSSEKEALDPVYDLLREMERSLIRLAHPDLLHLLVDYNDGLKHLMLAYQEGEKKSDLAIRTLKKLSLSIDGFIYLIGRADDMGIIV
jgi:hypothetical protein